MKYLQDAVRQDPSMVNEIHETLRTILTLAGVASREVIYEPLGWTQDEVKMLFNQQLRRKLNDVGISLPPDLLAMVGSLKPVLAGG
jgi:ribonucleoside-diphosphate reductase beta chain